MQNQATSLEKHVYIPWLIIEIRSSLLLGVPAILPNDHLQVAALRGNQAIDEVHGGMTETQKICPPSTMLVNFPNCAGNHFIVHINISVFLNVGQKLIHFFQQRRGDVDTDIVACIPCRHSPGQSDSMVKMNGLWRT